MNSQQKTRIEELTEELELGCRASDGIKHVLGKMPVTMSASRADRVIAELEAELEEKEEADLESDDLDVWAEAYARKMRGEAADCDR